MEDVVHEVAEKMVRRHPHVFGDVQVDGSGQVLENWEEIKKKEKAGKKQTESPLREIPLELPALARAAKVLKKADKLYEQGRDYGASVAALEEAVIALKQCQPGNYDEKIAGLLGDALMALSDVSRICKLSSEQILQDRIENFIEHCES
jgi:tetrapyrrole methylase family protein/MazG family protein